MTDQLSGRLAACESCNEGAIKVQLQIGNRLLRDALIRLLGKAKDLLVMGLNRETESADPAGSEWGCDVLIADTFDPEHFPNAASRSDEPHREVKFILIGMNDDPDKFLSAIRAGIAGYPMKRSSHGRDYIRSRSVVPRRTAHLDCAWRCFVMSRNKNLHRPLCRFRLPI